MNRIARIYCRVSTEEQDLTRQEDLVKFAQDNGYYVAKVYKEKASGHDVNRKVLNELIDDLQIHEVVIVEKVDRLSRLPLAQAQTLLEKIEEKGASVVVPELIHLIKMEVSEDSDLTKLITKTLHKLLLHIMLDFAHTDYQTRRERQKQGIELAKRQGKYKGRVANNKQHQSILALAKTGLNTALIAETLGCSTSQVRRIKRLHKEEI